MPDPVTEFDVFELLDRTNTTLVMFNTLHQDFKHKALDPKSQALCEEIESKLADLYQHLGSRLTEFPERNPDGPLPDVGVIR